MKITKEKIGDARYRIKVSIDKDTFEQKRKEVEKALLKKVKVDGFREGHVPEDIARQHIDPMLVLNEAANFLIYEHYGDILKESELNPIGQPTIQITKIAQGDDLELVIETDVLPEGEIADYKKIAKKFREKGEENINVDEKEVEDVILSFRKMRAQSESEDPKSWNEIDEKDLPELDDDYVKKLGDFSSVEDFKEKIRENIAQEKRAKAHDKKIMEMLEEIRKESSLEIPQSLIEHELNKMMHEFEGNIVATGISFDDYLKSINKTREDYRKEWREQAKKRAETEYILDEIARREHIEPEKEEVEKEVKALMERYKNAGLDEHIAREYVTRVLTHRAVIRFLEGKENND